MDKFLETKTMREIAEKLADDYFKSLEDALIEEGLTIELPESNIKYFLMRAYIQGTMDRLRSLKLKGELRE